MAKGEVLCVIAKKNTDVLEFLKGECNKLLFLVHRPVIPWELLHWMTHDSYKAVQFHFLFPVFSPSSAGVPSHQLRTGLLYETVHIVLPAKQSKRELTSAWTSIEITSAVFSSRAELYWILLQWVANGVFVVLLLRWVRDHLHIAWAGEEVFERREIDKFCFQSFLRKFFVNWSALVQWFEGSSTLELFESFCMNYIKISMPKFCLMLWYLSSFIKKF